MKSSDYRARIKEACNLLRQLVPGMSDKTDKATVFEFAARYVHFLKSHTGAQYDKVGWLCVTASHSTSTSYV